MRLNSGLTTAGGSAFELGSLCVLTCPTDCSHSSPGCFLLTILLSTCLPLQPTSNRFHWNKPHTKCHWTVCTKRAGDNIRWIFNIFRRQLLFQARLQRVRTSDYELRTPDESSRWLLERGVGGNWIRESGESWYKLISPTGSRAHSYDPIRYDTCFAGRHQQRSPESFNGSMSN